MKKITGQGPPRASGGPSTKSGEMSLPASEASRKLFRSCPFDWLTVHFRALPTVNMLKSSVMRPLRPRGQIAPPAPNSVTLNRIETCSISVFFYKFLNFLLFQHQYTRMNFFHNFPLILESSLYYP